MTRRNNQQRTEEDMSRLTRIPLGIDTQGTFAKEMVRVLIVDDDFSNRELVKAMLPPDRFATDEVVCGEDAITMVSSNSYDVVLLDKVLPGIGGDDVCRHIREKLGNHLLPLIVVTGSGGNEELKRSFSAGANDYITKPFNRHELVSRVDAAASRKRLTDQLDSAESMLFALARMVEAKDQCTGDHCSHLSHISTTLGKELGLPASDIKALDQGGVLHDIGKLGIPDSILLKNTSLDDAEWKLMQNHPLIGAELCRGLKSVQGAIPIIKFHHEKWDGTGYPFGIGGTEIPLIVRIFQIADIYDALANERPYKKAMSTGEIIGVFQQEISNGWRDPELGNYFLEILRKRPEILANPEVRQPVRCERPHRLISGI